MNPRRRFLGRCAGLAAAALLALGAQAKDAGLTRANFAAVGDSVADMLDTSGLAFSTMVMVALAEGTARPRAAAYLTPPPASAQSIRLPCPGGGSLQASLRDVDGSGDLSAGDRLNTLFDACAMDGSVVTGRSELLVAAHRYEGGTEVTELELRFDELGTRDMRWSGAAHVELRSELQRGAERYVATYLDLAVRRPQGDMRWNFRLEVLRPPLGEQLASVDGAMSLGELHLRLHQDTPFLSGADGVARAGQLSASDERGARLEVEAVGRRYDYRLYRAGNDGASPDAAAAGRPFGSR